MMLKSMIINRLRLLLVVMAYTLAVHAGNDEMPIIGYWGVPENNTSEENFRVMSECGFTVSLFPYSSTKQLVRACRAAVKYGVRVLGQCPEMTKAPAVTALTLKRERGFFGYFIQDEPSVVEIRSRQKEIERLKEVDNTHCFYINLLPYSDPKQILPAAKARTYPEYLRAASATSCQQLSFDFYPIQTSGLRETWYHTLEMVRQESLTSGKPFWGFVLSVPHAKYPQPTMASLRLQIYSNLAYGAQAIQYFTYWTPGKNPQFDFHDAPVDVNGKKTRTYALVQQMNQELKSVARLFYGGHIRAVHHLGVVSQGASRLTVAPVNLKQLKVTGKAGAVVSELEKDGHLYAVIVNKDYKKNMRVDLQTLNNLPRYVNKSLQEEPIKSSYTVLPGDLLLLKLR